MKYCLYLIFIPLINHTFADELHIAVAANFTKPLKQLIQPFEKKHNVIISFGSTGQLYMQINNGASFDVFLAADMERPQKLVNAGIANDLFVYAQGRLILWSVQANLQVKNLLVSGQMNYLAIAHPKIAPYGMATQQVLEKMGLWHKLQAKIVRGNNASQAYQFTVTGNAELGFIALSQYQNIGSYWLVDADLYAPILQGAVSLNQKPVTKEFMKFLGTSATRKMIRKLGYDN
jgi:molybdate transport system substrate-binding protein